jgi:hypothetical protein
MQWKITLYAYLKTKKEKSSPELDANAVKSTFWLRKQK